GRIDERKGPGGDARAFFHALGPRRRHSGPMSGMIEHQDADALVERAEACLARGDLNGAFAALKACLETSPDHRGATAAMGLFLAEHGDTGTAARLLSRAMALAGRDEA